MYERNPATAAFVYQLRYPPINAEGEIVDGWTAEKWWTHERMFWAEKQARAAERARRFHSGGVVLAHAPDLPDDAAFYAALDAGREWTGRWYSRDAVGVLSDAGQEAL